MIQLPVTGPTPVTFFTASLAGLYAVYARHVSDNQFIVKLNGTLATQVSTGETRSGLFYLEPSDILTANANGDSMDNFPATADLAVAWVGDGLA